MGAAAPTGLLLCAGRLLGACWLPLAGVGTVLLDVPLSNRCTRAGSSTEGIDNGRRCSYDTPRGSP